MGTAPSRDSGPTGGLGRDRDAERHEPEEAQRGQAGGEEIGFW